MEYKLEKEEIEEAILQYLVKEKGLDYDDLSANYSIVIDGSARTHNRMVVSGIHDNLSCITMVVRKLIKFRPVVVRKPGIQFRNIQ